MTKDQALTAWRQMRGGTAENPLRFMDPIPYKASGSKYGACGIRIDGNPEFVNAVLSRLTDLLDGENRHTRLELARREVETVLEIGGSKKFFHEAEAGNEVCYIRLHERSTPMAALTTEEAASTKVFEKLWEENRKARAAKKAERREMKRAKEMAKWEEEED